MAILTNHSTAALCQEMIKNAAECAHKDLGLPIENYLASLLIRYINRPELGQTLMGPAFMQALTIGHQQRLMNLLTIADECLLYVGLFPLRANARLVNTDYYSNIGKTAYYIVSNDSNDLFQKLAKHFSTITNVLQNIRPTKNEFFHLIPEEKQKYSVVSN